MVVRPGVSDVGGEGGVGARGGRVRGARVHGVEVPVRGSCHHSRCGRAAVRCQVVDGRHPDADRCRRRRRRRGRTHGCRGWRERRQLRRCLVCGCCWYEFL